MFRRSKAPLPIWSSLGSKMIVFEADGQTPTAMADAASIREAAAARARAARLASLCGGAESNNLHRIVSRSSALKNFMENDMGSEQEQELMSKPVLDRKVHVVSSLLEEQQRRVVVAKQQLRAAKRQLRMLRRQRRDEKRRLQGRALQADEGAATSAEPKSESKIIRSSPDQL